MQVSRNYFVILFILITLLVTYELSAFIIVLKNGKKIEADKYIDFKDKIKVVHNKVTLYIPKININYISKNPIQPKPAPTREPLVTLAKPTPTPIQTILEKKPETTPEIKLPDDVKSPEPAGDEIISYEIPTSKIETETVKESEDKKEEAGKADAQVIIMRGAGKEYFENWTENDFEPRAWALYNQAKDMGGDDNEQAIELLKDALKFDPYNDKIKMSIAEKSGLLGLKYIEAGNYFDAQKTFEQAFYFDLSQSPDYCFGTGLAKYYLYNFKFARSDLLEAQKRGMDTSELYFFLGNIAEELDNPAEAMKYWEKALLRDYKNKQVWNKILKGEYLYQPETEHFVIISLKEGNNSRGLILSRLLENFYPKIVEDLGFIQRTKFEVYIDPEKDFPLERNDPEVLSIDHKSYLYIACNNVHSYSWQLEQYLKSSLAYTAVNRATDYNAPEWLACGFSLYESGKRILKDDLKFLLDAMVNQDLIPITLMSGSFYGLTQEQYKLAEKQSLSLFEFLIKRLKFSSVKSLTQHLSRGIPIEVAIQRLFGISYLELEELWKEFLIRSS